MSAIRVRHLRLIGSLRSYDVSFIDQQGQVLPLSVIAGEISTGKTSILDFIAYCLGSRSFPTHEEIRRSVRSALLEIEIDDVSYVIERTCVGRPAPTAAVHSCSIETLEEPHRSIELKVQPTDDSSLSHFLLQHLGIAEVQLKEAPTQSSSGVDRLSIRDLLRLVYIRYQDLGSENLLQEQRPAVVRLKFEQVIDVLFDAHDKRASSIAAEIKQLQNDIDEGQGQLDAIMAFLAEQQVPSCEDLNERIAALDLEVAASEETLRTIEDQMAAVSHFGDQQRVEHQRAAQAANSAANRRRNAVVQIERLTALAAQYDQDVKKLTFSSQANALFDPLLTTVCPWCFQAVDASSADGTCTVCHQTLTSEDTANTALDIDKELRAIKKRQRELADLLDELHHEARQAEDEVVEAKERARLSQQALDRAMRARFTPYIDQRDVLTARRASAAQERDDQRRLLLMNEAASRRRAELGSLRQKRAELDTELADHGGTNMSRTDAIEVLAERYVHTLERFQFPKLSNAYLDGRYVPYARGQMYNDLGSAGAGTLVTLAWYLAIFETTAEQGGPHPGLLLIDSPQKGLRPTVDNSDDEFHQPSIAESVYQHLVDWAQSEVGRTTQLIIVDNSPQPVADRVGAVIVRFTADPAEPPYGLIDDATS